MKKLTFTVPEMARVLGISHPIAYELCSREDFPAVRVSSKRIVIPVDALNQWLMQKAGHKSN